MTRRKSQPPCCARPLRWKKGRFTFRSADVMQTETRQTIGGLLIEAMRLEDESRR